MTATWSSIYSLPLHTAHCTLHPLSIATNTLLALATICRRECALPQPAATLSETVAARLERCRLPVSPAVALLHWPPLCQTLLSATWLMLRFNALYLRQSTSVLSQPACCLSILCCSRTSLCRVPSGATHPTMPSALY
jgi:hypothetical protein